MGQKAIQVTKSPVKLAGRLQFIDFTSWLVMMIMAWDTFPTFELAYLYFGVIAAIGVGLIIFSVYLRGLGEFDELCLMEGSVLRMRGAYGTLMVDLTEDGVRKLLSKKEKYENED